MAIIFCPECGKEISDTNKKCPHCGFKLPKIKKSVNKKMRVVIIAIIIVLVLGVGGTVGVMQASKLNSEEQAIVTAINARINDMTQVTFEGMEKSQIEASITKLNKIKDDYSTLNWKEKLRTKGYGNVSKKIDEANNAIDTIINGQVKNIIDAINSIGSVSLDSKETIEKIESDYKELDEKYKDKVKNYSVLAAAREEYNKVAVNETISAIGNIGKVELTDKFENNIKRARDLYDGLQKECRSSVSNFLILTDKEKEYSKLTDKKDKLLRAKESIEKGNLNEAKNALKELPAKFSYKGTSVTSLNKILKDNEKWIGICGKWTNTNGRAETGCSAKSYSYQGSSWTSDFDDGDYSLEIRCKINKDNTITIIGNINFLVFTDYSTVQVGLDYETKNISFKKKISSSAIGRSISIGDNTQITINNSSISAKYDLYSTNENVSFNYSYITNVTYGKRTAKY